MQAVKGLQPGDVLESLYFSTMRGIIVEPMETPDCWVWYVAKKTPEGYEPTGLPIYSEIHPLSWKKS